MSSEIGTRILNTTDYYVTNNIELDYDASKVLLAVLLGTVILKAPLFLLALQVAPVLTGQTLVLLVAVPVLTRQILANQAKIQPTLIWLKLSG